MLANIQDAPDTERWVGVHWLGLAHHPTERQGKLDFPLPTRYGVFVLEVKGGQVIDETSDWSSVNKCDRHHKLNESPFKQAADAMLELQRHIKLGFEGKVQSQILFGFGVVTPHIEFTKESS